MPRRLDRAAAPWILTLVLLVLGLDAWAKAPVLTDAQRIKILQRQILLREPAERRESLERRAKWKKKSARKGGARVRRPGEGPNDLTIVRQPDFFAPARLSALSAAAAPSNVLMNDTTGEPLGSCQSEISIASHGNNVVAVWNDGIGIYESPPTDVLGYAYSTDGGVTWTDGGAPPDNPVGTWASDPVVVVNEKTGTFYFSGLTDSISNASNSVAMIRGAFTGNTFAWGTPHVVANVPNTLALLDKEWIAVDSLSGNLYVTYSYFFGSGDEIRMQRSTNEGATWSAPITLSSAADNGYVQGSRPAVGPDGEVYAVWHAIGPSSSTIGVGPDYMRVRRSDNFGVSFGPQVTPASIFSNFGSGGPGFNRGLGITFPGIAVDRSQGPHRGRVYVSWAEAVNFPNDYYPRPGVDPSVSEVENNGGANFGTPFAPGVILRGEVATPTDLDYYKWNAVQGQTYVFWVDSLANTNPSLDASLRIFCTDASTSAGTNLAFSQNGQGGEDLIAFTAPSTATYFLRIASYKQQFTGKYRIRTTIHNPALPGRARDHRDVFVTSSDDGLVWSTPVRANDSPGYFDDFLPEVVVDGFGHVYMDCYDWRDSAPICGGGSSAYLYRSDDGGATWGAGSRLSNYSTAWSATFSSLIPNQGDYIGLYARDSVVFAAWADARGFQGDPNAYLTRVGEVCGGPPVTALSADVSADSIVVTWAVPAGTAAELFRREGSGSFVDIGPYVADPQDRIAYTDTSVVAGVSYTYRLAIPGYCLPYGGEISATIAPPQGPRLTLLKTWPNPARGSLNLTFVLDGTSRPAALSLIDVSGREIKRVDVTGQNSYLLDLTPNGVDLAPPGMYFVRLSQGDAKSSRRVIIFP